MFFEAGALRSEPATNGLSSPQKRPADPTVMLLQPCSHPAPVMILKRRLVEPMSATLPEPGLTSPPERTTVKAPEVATRSAPLVANHSRQLSLTA